MEAGISKLGVESRGRHLRSSAWTGDHGDHASNETLAGEDQGEGERPCRAQRERRLGEESEERGGAASQEAVSAD